MLQYGAGWLARALHSKKESQRFTSELVKMDASYLHLRINTTTCITSVAIISVRLSPHDSPARPAASMSSAERPRNQANDNPIRVRLDATRQMV